jgi:hypothetical protein
MTEMSVVMEYFTRGTLTIKLQFLVLIRVERPGGGRKGSVYLNMLKFYCSPHRCPVSASVFCIVDHI